MKNSVWEGGCQGDAVVCSSWDTSWARRAHVDVYPELLSLTASTGTGSP